MIRIVGLGPGDPGFLTLGSLEALRALGRAVAVLAPPELQLFLESEGVALLRDRITDPSLFMRGSSEVIDAFVGTLDGADLAIGILGNPLSDFPGLPILLRALERRGVAVELVPGMPRVTLQASLAMPLVPLPPNSHHYAWDDLVEVMSRLRSGCPWDREQTHRTLVPFLVEETYELAEAIEQDDDREICEELGDVLLQIVFHAQLAMERGKFSVADVIDGLANKMVRRHPHVFGDTAAPDVATVWKNWEELKSTEASAAKRASKLDGIPVGLGALQRGQKMQDKAARVGFDWPDIGGVTEKLVEELRELAEARAGATGKASDDAHVREEFGDVLFTIVNFARRLGLDAESTLREANEKFYRRFTFMEKEALLAGRELKSMQAEELEALWSQAKRALAAPVQPR